RESTNERLPVSGGAAAPCGQTPHFARPCRRHKSRRERVPSHAGGGSHLCPLSCAQTQQLRSSFHSPVIAGTRDQYSRVKKKPDDLLLPQKPFTLHRNV